MISLKRKFILFTVFLLLGSIVSCFTIKPTPFKGRYKKFLKSGETEIRTTYQSMVSKKGNTDYVFRFFYPEKMLLTQEVHYLDQFLKYKNGQSTKWHENGKLASTGQNKNNMATGEWKHYQRKTGKIKKEGSMLDDMPYGEWKEYDEQGRLKEISVYNDGVKNGTFEQFDSTGVKVNSGVYQGDSIISQTLVLENDTGESVKEIMPYLLQCSSVTNEDQKKICSDNALIKYLYTNLKYPRKAREYGVEGRAFVEFFVEEDGSVADIEVVVALSDFLKDACYGVVQNIPPWVAGSRNGEHVRVKYTLPITFKLE